MMVMILFFGYVLLGLRFWSDFMRLLCVLFVIILVYLLYIWVI